MENKVTLLWRSNKTPEIMCADYLSRFMDNARHENITIKFSNKLPKLKEEDLWSAKLEIPEQYKINETPITYKDLVSIFKRTPIPNIAKSLKSKMEESIQTEEVGTPEFEEMVEKFRRQAPHIDEEQQLQPGCIGDEPLSLDETAGLNHTQATICLLYTSPSPRD